MTHEFDKDYWEEHWREREGGPSALGGTTPNPYLATELGDLAPGTALDAGCGGGAEAIWLAEAGWEVTAADISSVALAGAAERASAYGAAERVQWVEADLGTWEPTAQFDLVTTHYAHPPTPQLEFYDRLATWVAPGGTLLIVGHLLTHDHGHGHGHGHGQGQGQGHDQGEGEGEGHSEGHGHTSERPPAEACVTAADVTARLDDAQWTIVTAAERQRTVVGQEAPLDDVVVRATRRRQPATDRN